MATYDNIIEEYRGFNIHRMDYCGDGGILFQGRKGSVSAMNFCFTPQFWQLPNLKIYIDAALDNPGKLFSNPDLLEGCVPGDEFDQGDWRAYRDWAINTASNGNQIKFVATRGLVTHSAITLDDLHTILDKVDMPEDSQPGPNPIPTVTPMLPATEINILIPNFKTMFETDRWHCEEFRFAVSHLIMVHFKHVHISQLQTVLKAMAFEMSVQGFRRAVDSAQMDEGNQ